MMGIVENQILSVSELTKEIKFTLEEKFSRISVIGEISNFKAHISGHWYFNLKDSLRYVSFVKYSAYCLELYYLLLSKKLEEFVD